MLCCCSHRICWERVNVSLMTNKDIIVSFVAPRIERVAPGRATAIGNCRRPLEKNGLPSISQSVT
jgi:hypothetical protein